MLITNFRNEDKWKYKKALDIYIKETGDRSLYIDGNAYLRNRQKDISASALRCHERKSLHKFWAIFDSL